MFSPEMKLPHQELAAKSVERVDKLIDKDAAARVDAGTIAAVKERASGLKERLKGLETGGNIDEATATELSEDIAKLETHLLTRGEIDKIPLDDKDGPPLDDAQKAHIKKLIFAKPSWLQEKIADPATSPEMVALYKAAVDARGVATENAGVEQAIKTQEAWGAHNNETARKMADIVNKFLDKPASDYGAFGKDIYAGHMSDAWEKMDDATRKQLKDIAGSLVSETRYNNKPDGRVEDVQSVFVSSEKSGKRPPETSILSKVLQMIEENDPERSYTLQEIDKSDVYKDVTDKKPVADAGKKLREAYLASKAPKAK